MHELEVKVDLRVQELIDYDTPDYKLIKDILMDRLSLEKVIPGK